MSAGANLVWIDGVAYSQFHPKVKQANAMKQSSAGGKHHSTQRPKEGYAGLAEDAGLSESSSASPAARAFVSTDEKKLNKVELPQSIVKAMNKDIASQIPARAFVSTKYVTIEGVSYSQFHPVAIAHRKRMAGLSDTVSEHGTLPALERRPTKQRGRKGRVAISVTITSYRSRRIDNDNLIAGAKPLRDSIARSLGLDDGDERITWEYRSIVTTGATGTHILISAK